MLREAGVAVEVGGGRDHALALLRPYLKYRETGLPYVIGKFAASLDGQVAARTGDSVSPSLDRYLTAVHACALEIRAGNRLHRPPRVAAGASEGIP
ncbi:MAG: hypothetical protein Kow0010_21350 [Dehalococcoidia bacterium]